MTDLSKYDHIVWDWNGTLLDDLDLVHAILLQQLASVGLAPLTQQEYRKKFRFPVSEFYKDIGFDLSRHDIEDSSRYFHKEYEARVLSEAKIFEDALKALRTIKESNRTQCIVSAHTHDKLEIAVEKFGIADAFSGVYGNKSSTSHAISKADQARAWMSDSKLDPRTVVWIGDTDHDAHIASSLGIKCVLVSHGHQDEEVLLNTGTPVIKTLKEIIW